MYSQILDKNRNVFRAVLKLFTDEELHIYSLTYSIFIARQQTDARY